MWATISNLFSKPRSVQAHERLAIVYRNVFSKEQDGQIVLADLANKSGYYRVTDARQATDRELWQAEGKRMMFAEIMAFLNLSDEDFQELHNAARREAAYDEQFQSTNKE